MSVSDAKREPFQFRLQTLLILVLFVALAIGAIQLSYRCRRLSLECEEAEARLTIQREEAKELRRVADQLQGETCTLKNLIGNVDGQQQASGSAIQDLIAGKSKDILPVVHAVAEADLSFKLLMGVRNKVIEAYQQTMRMQI